MRRFFIVFNSKLSLYSNSRFQFSQPKDAVYFFLHWSHGIQINCEKQKKIVLLINFTYTKIVINSVMKNYPIVILKLGTWHFQILFTDPFYHKHKNKVINFLKCTRTLWTPCMYIFFPNLSNPFPVNHCSAFSYSHSFSCALYSDDSSWQTTDKKLRKYKHFNQRKTFLLEKVFFKKVFIWKKTVIWKKKKFFGKKNVFFAEKNVFGKSFFFGKKNFFWKKTCFCEKNFFFLKKTAGKKIFLWKKFFLNKLKKIFLSKNFFTSGA